MAVKVNEVHFFDKNYDRGLEWYRQRMEPSTTSQLTLEGSPSYFFTDKVPERVKAMNSSIKLLVILRDPVTRLISEYDHERALNRSGRHTFM